MRLNELGIISIDFLFAIVIAGGMSALVFVFTYTLTVFEVTQYIVYSAARAHLAGNVDPASQDLAARKKYESLIGSPAFKSIYSNGWFEISPPQQLDIRQGDKNFSADYPAQTDQNREVFHGVRTQLTAKLLELNLPFIGEITPENDSFNTRVGAFLIREPTFLECKTFMEARSNSLWQAGNNRFSIFNRNAATDIAWEDNGC